MLMSNEELIILDTKWLFDGNIAEYARLSRTIELELLIWLDWFYECGCDVVYH